ncbi:hypothetical protein QN391_21355 [Pseudomonas sp. CCI1.2]|uniref:hypothetical protein n=1 Tax=Pseudomonas sp. CCI1.2 TaxID=3048614 RepID=UPI002B22AD23|nr:hypothetical protein [Pseudomonas sp. CCI1.2]MEB0123207.1 hypothetical protein [Pseudomonas sp. CCI1.2]
MILASMTLCRGHEADAAVAVLVVVSADKFRDCQLWNVYLIFGEKIVVEHSHEGGLLDVVLLDGNKRGES